MAMYNARRPQETKLMQSKRKAEEKPTELKWALAHARALSAAWFTRILYNVVPNIESVVGRDHCCRKSICSGSLLLEGQRTWA